MKTLSVSIAGLLLLSSAACVSAQQSTAEDATLCETYCTNAYDPAVSACTGEYQIYESREACMDTCQGFPDAAPEGAIAGNSVQCRIEHALLAQGDEGPAKHCPHAAPLGGGVCSDRSPCQTYCAFYYDRVVDGSCPAIEAWGEPGTVEQGTGHFIPNPSCMEACLAFPASGVEFEMSGNSANCRAQYFLMAFRESDPTKQADLCQNAHPTETEMCTGYTFGSEPMSTNAIYTVRTVDPCKELCYNDWLTCGSSYGTPDECMEACAAIPQTGQRGDTTGNSVYCRLNWAQNAFFQKSMPPVANLICGFAAPESPVCVDRRQPGR